MLPFTRTLVLHNLPPVLSGPVLFGNFTEEEMEEQEIPLIQCDNREISHVIPASSNIILFGNLSISETLDLSSQLLEIRNPILLCERCDRPNHTKFGCFSETRLDGMEICDFVIKSDDDDDDDDIMEDIVDMALDSDSYLEMEIDQSLKRLYYITDHVMQSHAYSNPDYPAYW